jgi:head-tail adaptor
VSKRNYKATFEVQLQPLDHFTGESGSREVICREYVSLSPMSGRELIEAEQVQSQTTHKVFVNYGASMARVTTAHRMKIARPVAVDNDDPEADANYRIFNIESIVNVNEANRELQMMVVERQT